ncbi:MAG TPA: ThuA domain-containing protein [Vicinamibacterales bacterium]
MRRVTGWAATTLMVVAGTVMVWVGAPGAQAPQQPAASGQPQSEPPQTGPAAPAGQPGAQAAAPRRFTGPPPAPKKKVLVVGMTLGWHHDSVSDAMATIWKLGRESNAFDVEIRTDVEWITKKPLKPVRRNLNDFDAIVFASTTGELPLTEDQKADFLSFIRDDGKGFVGVHAALDTNYKWPEYGEMIGGYFDGHPWNTFDAPVIVEDPTFPAMRHFAPVLTLHDEMYQAKTWSRDKVNVLMRLDETKLDYTGKNRLREDRDFAITWSKMYGKGRVFYSSLGHTREAWQDPDIQKMYLEAIKWVLGRTEGSTTPHPRPRT